MQIGSLIRRAGRQFGDAPCLVLDDRTISFAEFDSATDRLGNALLATGLQPGDRVGVLLPNSLECIIAYYALAKNGLIRVGMNTRETDDDHRYKLADSGARAVLQKGNTNLGVEMSFDWNALSDMITNGDDAPCSVDRALDAPYRLGYTGGTTGKPKAVTLTERGELAELSAFLTDLMPDIRAGDTFLHAAPIAHASGAFFLPMLVRGARSTVMPKFNPADFVTMAQDTGATLTFLVPTMLAMILEEPTARTADFRFRRIAYGASSIAQSLLERAEKRFGRVFAQTYGQAESPMVITCLKPEDHDRVGSCGRPFTISEVKVLDDDDREVPVGQTGEICCRGPQLMAYYWNRPEATEKTMRNGWLHTGDVGRMDEDGFFYILDRKNDMLVSGGYNIYPREIEDALGEYDGVVEVAVVGIPDEKWGDRVQAVVSGRAGLDADKLLAFAKSRLAGHKCPKAIEIWDELPKSAANKILRRKVRDHLIGKQTEGETV
jgi:acyl-CoA synthetase (AMP-forming)/AMP-acid ligase II